MNQLVISALLYSSSSQSTGDPDQEHTKNRNARVGLIQWGLE